VCWRRSIGRSTLVVMREPRAALAATWAPASTGWVLVGELETRSPRRAQTACGAPRPAAAATKVDLDRQLAQVAIWPTATTSA
jgi:hypothetical protein